MDSSIEAFDTDGGIGSLERTYILLFGQSLVVAAVIGTALGHLLGLGVKLAVAGGHLEALRCRGHRVVM